jgi:hypothetical protein
MAAEESRSQVWIIADELPVLRRQAELETLVVRGRKRGLCAVLGFQAITQLRAIYGHDQTATLAVLPIVAFGAQRSATMIVVATATSVAVILLSGYVPSILAHYRFFVPGGPPRSNPNHWNENSVDYTSCGNYRRPGYLLARHSRWRLEIESSPHSRLPAILSIRDYKCPKRKNVWCRFWCQLNVNFGCSRMRSDEQKP